MATRENKSTVLRENSKFGFMEVIWIEKMKNNNKSKRIIIITILILLAVLEV